MVVGNWIGTVYKTVIAHSTAFMNRSKGENDVHSIDRHSQLDNVSYGHFSK